MNEKLQKIWNEIDGSTVYYVRIGIEGSTPYAKIEDREGITFKKTEDGIIFTHKKTMLEIPITNEVAISEYPGGSSSEIPDCLGIHFHTKDCLISASIEYSADKSQEYYQKL